MEGPIGAVVVVGDVSEVGGRKGNEGRLGATSGDGVGGVLFGEPNLLFLSGRGVGEVDEGVGGEESGRSVLPTSERFRFQCCACCFFGFVEEGVVGVVGRRSVADGRLWRPECRDDGVGV
jgi:hypothetical protein